MCGQVWWPILWICALHLAHSSAHRHTHTVNTHPEQWAANAAAPGSNWVTHLKWAVSKWKSVLWSDESKCDILVGNHRHLVLRAKKEGDLSACYQRSVQKPPSLMVWGCITAYGVGNLHVLEGTMNAERYIKVLEQHMLPSRWRVFQQDNAKPHTAAITTAYCSYYNRLLQCSSGWTFIKHNQTSTNDSECSGSTGLQRAQKSTCYTSLCLLALATSCSSYQVQDTDACI